MASPDTAIDIERMMADDIRAQQFRREHPQLFNRIKVGDFARRENGHEVRVVKSIVGNRVYLQPPGKKWLDWESLGRVVLVRPAEDAEASDPEPTQS